MATDDWSVKQMRDSQHDKGIIINKVGYLVPDKEAAIVHALLCLVDAVNDLVEEVRGK